MKQTTTYPLPDCLSGSEPCALQPTGCLVVYSSGSSGVAKEVVRSRQTWIDSAITEAAVFGISPTDRFAVLGGAQHSLWGYAHFRSDYLGALCVGVQKISLANLRTLLESSVTVIYGVPDLVGTMLRLCKHHSIQLPSVRRILLGGGPVLPRFPVDHLHQICPVAITHRFYGATETSFIGHASLHGYYVAFPRVQVRIDDDQMMWVQSPFTVAPCEWIATGDLGRWVGQKAFEVLGRSSRQIQVKGKKYAVEPIEQALMDAFVVTHLALVQDAKGRVNCVVASEESPPALNRINHIVQFVSPGFPLARLVHVLPLSKWPLTQSGKTDWVALAGWLQGNT